MYETTEQKTFEGLLKTLTATHKSLMAYQLPAALCSIYSMHAKSFTVAKYIPITEQVKNDPRTFLSLENQYFCDFQKVAELMEYADAAYKASLAQYSEAVRDQSVQSFREHLIAKASKETREYYSKYGTIPNQTSNNSRTTNPNGDGK